MQKESLLFPASVASIHAVLIDLIEAINGILRRSSSKPARFATKATRRTENGAITKSPHRPLKQCAFSWSYTATSDCTKCTLPVSYALKIPPSTRAPNKTTNGIGRGSQHGPRIRYDRAQKALRLLQVSSVAEIISITKKICARHRLSTTSKNSKYRVIFDTMASPDDWQAKQRLELADVVEAITVELAAQKSVCETRPERGLNVVSDAKTGATLGA